MNDSYSVALACMIDSVSLMTMDKKRAGTTEIGIPYTMYRKQRLLSHVTPEMYDGA